MKRTFFELVSLNGRGNTYITFAVGHYPIVTAFVIYRAIIDVNGAIQMQSLADRNGVIDFEDTMFAPQYAIDWIKDRI